MSSIASIEAPIAPGVPARRHGAIDRRSLVVRSADRPARVDSTDKGEIVLRQALFDRLRRAGRVTVVSAPAGSGKTVLLASWISDTGLAERAARVCVPRGEHDAKRFWLAVLDAVRETTAGSILLREVAVATNVDGWTIVERLLDGLESLEEPLWLVIDDLHELMSNEGYDQLDLLLTHAPEALRLVLVGRREPTLRLHHLRLQGDLTEIRARDLRFTRDEALELVKSAGAALSDAAVADLLERTEGWAAGLRLAARSLVDHPDPHGFAAEFSGSERTVADYLLAEVLDRQPEQVRRLLVRTAMLERVSGPLADALTGDSVASGSCRNWNAATHLSSRSTPVGPGFATTARSPIYFNSSYGVPSQTKYARCTPQPPNGLPSITTRPKRSATPKRPRTGALPPACSQSNGST
jgi:LuxR family maltose regulon positive regulatory protein